MKFKSIVVISGLLLTMILGGCGKTESVEAPADVEETAVVDNQVNEQSGEQSEEQPEEKDEVLSAYKEILESAPALQGEHMELEDASFGYEENFQKFGQHYDWFSIVDVNQDGNPELIAETIINNKWTQVYIFSYQDGKAVLHSNPIGVDAGCTIDQCSVANGAYSLYICEENHIHSVWRGMTPMGDEAEENYAYVIEGGSITQIECSSGENENTQNIGDLLIANVPENMNF